MRTIIEDKLDIRGSYSKPTYNDILWVQLVLLPYTCFLWAKFYIRWWYKFSYKQEEYGDEERGYLIRRHLGLSQCQWEQLDDEERQDYVQRELWVKEHAVEYKQQLDEENKAKLAESSSHKRYRRWMRKGGPSTLSFMDD